MPKSLIFPQAIEDIIPKEVDHLKKYDEMNAWLDNNFEMPDKMIAMLIRFMEQNNSSLSRRAQEKELKDLTAEEINQIEQNYIKIFEKQTNPQLDLVFGS